MKAVCSSEMSGTIYQLTQYNNAKDLDLEANLQQIMNVSSSINHVVLLLISLRHQHGAENFIRYVLHFQSNDVY
jgi:hypothetical protein